MKKFLMSLAVVAGLLFVSGAAQADHRHHSHHHHGHHGHVHGHLHHGHHHHHRGFGFSLYVAPYRSFSYYRYAPTCPPDCCCSVCRPSYWRYRW